MKKRRNRNKWQIVHDASYTTYKENPTARKGYRVWDSDAESFHNRSSGLVRSSRFAGFTKRPRDKR